MNLIRVALERPIAVIAAVLMIVMFGIVALNTIPIQLAPDVRKPIITVTTNWFGAAPAEIEREIVNRQEDVFKGLEGLDRIESRSQDGRAEITLEFINSQNMDKALLLVANRLLKGDEVLPVLHDYVVWGLTPLVWLVVNRVFVGEYE